MPFIWDWLEKLRGMSWWQRLLAIIGGFALVGYWLADFLDRINGLLSAPDNARNFLWIAWRMIADTNPLAWALLFVGVACLLIASFELWRPWLQNAGSDAASRNTSALAVSGNAPLLPYDVDARSALLYTANRTWTQRSYNEPVNDGTADELSRVFKSLDEFYELASAGSIRVWGRTDRTRPPIPVETTHWQNWHIDYTTLFTGPDSDPIRTVPRDRLPHDSSPYFDLRLNKSEIERAWPPLNAKVLMVPSDADAITRALREIRDVLYEAGRDSTTIPGHFQNVTTSSQSLNLIKQQVADARALGSNTNNAVSSILAKYRSYANDLAPFNGSLDFPDALITELESYRQVLSTFRTLEGTALEVVRGFNSRIAVGLRDYYKHIHGMLGVIDARIDQIRQRISN